MNKNIELKDEFKQIYKRLVMEVDTDIQLESVILSDDNKKKVDEFIKENEYIDKFVKHGLKPMNRLLFYGASGCGKTYLAKALSNHLNYTMLYVDIARSLSEGDVAINISDIFKLANELIRCIIFFDECDSIAWSRDSGDHESGDIRRATNSIFQHIDQMNPNNIFIAATNILHRLDPAFERRFNMKLEFRRPELNLKEAISRFVFKGFIINDDVDKTVKTIVERRTRLSYYEIQDIVERAMKRALMNDTIIVNTSDIYRDFATTMNIKIHFKTDKDPEEIFMSSIK